MRTVALRFWPAFNASLSQPARRFGASQPPAAGATYTCATALPSRRPVFLTANVTVTAPSRATAATSLTPKLVYDKPWPNANSGVMPCLSNHL